MSAPSWAVVLTFDGDICSSDVNGGGSAVSCSNGMSIHQSYGDQANANVTWSNNGAPSMQWWSTGWLGTPNQAWGSDFVITIIPTAGYKIQLNSFDLSPFTDTRSYTSLSVLGHGTGTPGFNDGGDTISILTPSPGLPLTSSAGFDISVVGTFGNIGIDNIDFDVVLDDAVPEPATFGIAALALGALVLKKRS